MKSLVAVALAFALALSGCASASTQLDADGNTLLVASPQQPSVDRLALITGTIAIGSGGCYGLENEHGFFVAVFPAGTSLDDDEGIVVGDDAFAVGDSWEGGGGYIRPSESPAEIPEACASTADVITLGRPE